jgi:hypothetical protein
MADSGLPMFAPHHAGIVVSDLERAMNSYISDFGYIFYQFKINEMNATLAGSSAAFSLRFGLGQLGMSLLELIQPVSGATLYSQHLVQRGPGPHHLALSTLPDAG